MQEKQETWVQPLGQEDPLEEEMTTHFSILTWRIPMDRGAWWDWARVCGRACTHTHTQKYVFGLLAIFLLSYHIDVVMCVHRFRERDGKGRRIFITEKRKAMQDPIKTQGTELLFFQMHHLCLSDIHSFLLSNFFSKILRVLRFQWSSMDVATQAVSEGFWRLGS